MTHRPELKVLFSTRRHAMDRNPYLQQLASHLNDVGIQVEPWLWRSALLGQYDVLHVHWPEYVVSHRRRALAFVYGILSRLLLYKLRRDQVPVVRTVHNHTPHFAVSSGAQRRTQALDALTVHRVHLHDGMSGSPGTTVLHGHYSDWYARHTRSSPIRGRFLFFGLIRPYKGVPALISAFKDIHDVNASLSIIGEPETKTLADELSALAASDSRITLKLNFASEEELARQISDASVVVLPYSEVFNSGAALLALSLDRRVLVADSPSMHMLASEVGHDWVRTYSGVIDCSHLVAALEYPYVHQTPDLSKRAWPDAASAHRLIYCNALAPRSQEA